MAGMQTERQVAVSSPLGEDVLLFHRMSGNEQLGRLFEFQLDLLSEDEQIVIEDILAQNLTVSLTLPNDETRYFNGIVSRFTHVGAIGRYAAYKAILRPWFWFLTRTADCRIFQEQTVPNIIKGIFREYGYTDFDEALSNSYRTWTYCVQYCETDFNFISRLMEQEGIYYYFRHEDGKHVLVLSDSYSAHELIPGYEEIPYFPPDDSAVRERDHITQWLVSQEVQPGTYSLNDFDFEVPKKDLHVKRTIMRQHAQPEFEIYHYPGEYVKSGDGDNYVRTRIEELHTQYELTQGESNARGLTPGGLFELTGYPRDDQNREYLTVSASYELESDIIQAGSSGGGPVYACSITAIDSHTPYRPPRITPKPVIQGPQTAIVVGPAGEEIWPDQYARVKVQFHWDREGQQDENSSCWVRVAQLWAGKTWGGIHIPRIGQEVIVEFLEGDPDRPIITGRVYNADEMPPYGLPANKTQSGIKSRSSKGGTGANFNEFRFEDKKGSEQVYLHAEKNQDIVVENDETHSVGHDRTKTIGNDETTDVGHDRTESVGNDEKITIGNNRTESVGNNEEITIGANRTEKVGSNETITIGSNRSVTIGSNKTETIAINKAETIGVAKELTIGAAYQVTVGAAMNETVGASKSVQVGASKSLDVGASSSENIGNDKSVNVGDNQSTSVGKDDSLKVGKNLVIDAGDSIVIKTGKASISMKKDGTITIEGKDITVKGSGKINIKASQDVIIKGTKILQN